MKNEREEVLLGKWCRDRNLDALAELFDLVAPRLLKLAVHLVGEASEAEDLVQQTFVVVIERRESIDLDDPVMPWLVGVLNKKAANARRRRARRPDLALLEEREVESPDAPLEQRELSGELAKAADQLPEPYRQVVLLRLRHGMSIADMAHLLERSPGTVRVQLHRAHERLRQQLPASLVGALATELGVFVGLGPMKLGLLERAALIPEAAAVTAGLSLSPTLGAWIVSQKLVAIGLCAALLIAASLWNLEDEPAGREAAPQLDIESTQSLPAIVSRAGEGDAVDAGEEDSERVSLESIASLTTAQETLHGNVIDAATGDPVAGALVEIHPPRVTTRHQLLVDYPELYTVDARGSLLPRTRGDWPRIEDSSDAARFDRETFRVFDLPVKSATALARTYSSHDGSFALPIHEGGGLLVVTHDDYARRLRAAHDPSESWTISMHRHREFSGQLRFSGGREPAEPLTLVISSVGLPNTPAHHSSPQGPRESSDSNEAPRPATLVDEEVVMEGVGVWTVKTDAEGRFSTPVAANKVRVDILDVGWSADSPAVYDVDREAFVIVGAVLTLHIVTEESDDPIEHVHLLAKDRSNGYIKLAGGFAAPDGFLNLPFQRSFLRYLAEDALGLTVWAEGFEPANYTLVELDKVREHEIRLMRGSTPHVTGRVSRAGVPCSQATVALLGLSSLQWNEEDDFAVDGARVDPSGAFDLSAPRGLYVLRVRDGAQTYYEVVDVPGEDSVMIDLDRLASLGVKIVDSEGTVQAKHVVAARGPNGRSLRGHTDSTGWVVFDGLPPTTFQVAVPHVTTEFSFSADELAEAVLLRGERTEVTLEIPVNRGPRYARLVVPDAGNFNGWRAGYAGYDNLEAVESDGTIPHELSTAAYEFVIEAPDGRRWGRAIPKQSEDGVEIYLDEGGASYVGRVLNAEGQPLSHARVFAEAWRTKVDSPVRVSAVTDESGRFELSGLGDHAYRLVFHQDPTRERLYDYDSDYKGVSFLPHKLPGESRWLEIRLATDVERLRLRGVVRRESDGTAVADNLMFIECQELQEHGTLSLGIDAGFIRTDAEGRFDLMVPRTEQRTFRVFGSGPGKPNQLETTRKDSGVQPLPEVELLVP